MTDTLSPARTPVRSQDHVFFVWMSVVFLLVTFIGFARSYYLASFTGAPSLTPIVARHGAVFTLWPLLFAAQTTLVATRRVRVHRALGVAGGGLAVVMLAVGLMASIESARLGHRGSGPVEMPDALMFLAIPVRDLVIFGTLTAAALWYRRTSAAHKRLLVLATIGLMPAPIGRVQALGPGLAIAGVIVALALTLSGPVYDWFRYRHVHGAYKVGVPFLVTAVLLTRPVAWSGWWHSVAAWLVGMPR